MSSADERQLTPESDILLTGATGLIGGELLRGLATRGRRRMRALVRPRGGYSPSERLLDRFRGCGDTAELLAAVEVVAGDITAPDFGLACADREHIVREVTTIIHCAAETSFVDEGECRRANIDGVERLVRLARSCERLSLLVYVSSACRVGSVEHAVVVEDDPSSEEHPNEYTRTKSEAEHRLRGSGLPVLILRPSIVIAAGLARRDFARAILWFLPLLQRFDALPIDPESRLDIVPVAFVVEATLALLEQERRFDCYHLSAGAEGATSCGVIGRFLDSHYRRATPLKLVPPRDWTPSDRRRAIDTPLRRATWGRLRPYLPFINMDAVFDASRLSSELGRSAAEVRPFLSYAAEVLDRVTLEEALSESWNP